MANEGDGSTQAAHEGPFNIVVNAQPKKWDKPRISFEELVHLAFPTPPPGDKYTITYTKGPPRNREGTLKEGHSVWVDNGMVFDVVPTTKS
jgi:Multiubiquitin